MTLQGTILPRVLGIAKSHAFRPLSFSSRPFSVSSSRRANALMETSGFSDTQMQVREAIAKICSNFPDVSAWIQWTRIHVEYSRNTGQNMMSLENIHMNYILHWQKMDG